MVKHSFYESMYLHTILFRRIASVCLLHMEDPCFHAVCLQKIDAILRCVDILIRRLVWVVIIGIYKRRNAVLVRLLTIRPMSECVAIIEWDIKLWSVIRNLNCKRENFCFSLTSCVYKIKTLPWPSYFDGFLIFQVKTRHSRVKHNELSFANLCLNDSIFQI